METIEQNEGVKKKSKASAGVRTVDAVPPRKKGPNWSRVIVVVLVVVLGAFAAYSRYELYKLTNPNYQQQLADAKAKNIVAEVSRVMLLPDDMPQIATVQDSGKLRTTQAFFANAKNGDEILIFKTEAVLYRPSEHKIINVASLSASPVQSPAQVSTTVVLRVAYYNGTDTVGLAKTTEATVKGKYPNTQTILSADASHNTYTQTLVVDLSGKHTKEAADIAGILGGKVGPLPEGETAPKADILVISGK